MSPGPSCTDGSTSFRLHRRRDGTAKRTRTALALGPASDEVLGLSTVSRVHRAALTAAVVPRPPPDHAVACHQDFWTEPPNRRLTAARRSAAAFLVQSAPHATLTQHARPSLSTDSDGRAWRRVDAEPSTTRRPHQPALPSVVRCFPFFDGRSHMGPAHMGPVPGLVPHGAQIGVSKKTKK